MIMHLTRQEQDMNLQEEQQNCLGQLKFLENNLRIFMSGYCYRRQLHGVPAWAVSVGGCRNSAVLWTGDKLQRQRKS